MFISGVMCYSWKKVDSSLQVAETKLVSIKGTSFLLVNWEVTLLANLSKLRRQTMKNTS